MKNSNLLNKSTGGVKLLFFLVTVGLMLQLTSCGTLFYPERRGQIGGRIDPAVVMMDGIGVLFFVIPGLIAFVVDFSTGAIYFPTETSQIYPVSLDESPMIVIHENPKNLNMSRVEEIVASHTGRSINLIRSNVRIYELKNNEDIRAEIAAIILE